MGRINVISIRPEYAKKIYEGEKLFEFRKVPPRSFGTRFFVYESAPISTLTGTLSFDLAITVRADKMVGTIAKLMDVNKNVAIGMMGISEDDLIAYAGLPERYITALRIEYALSDPFIGSRFRIRPPQNWGAVRVGRDGE